MKVQLEAISVSLTVDEPLVCTFLLSGTRVRQFDSFFSHYYNTSVAKKTHFRTRQIHHHSIWCVNDPLQGIQMFHAAL